ncbi:MAG: hypothetical protein ACLR0U_08390 [Enterocloster clostridioformis]
MGVSERTWNGGGEYAVYGVRYGGRPGSARYEEGRNEESEAFILDYLEDG